MPRRIAFGFLFLTGLASPLIMSFGIRHFASMPPNEVARTTSPDLRYDAVVLKREPPLKLTRTATEVYVVAHGQTVGPRDSPIMIATQAQGVQGAWRGDHLLEIHYSSARIAGFSAMWPPRSKTSPEIEIRLVPPAGGLSFPPNDAS